MKKVLFSLMTIVALSFLVASCGPSKEEIEAKRIADSTLVADSIAKVQFTIDSIAKVDSTAKADSIAKITVVPAKKGK